MKLSVKKESWLRLFQSEIEWKFVKVNAGRNVSNLTSVDSYLICKHARSRDFNRIRPIIVAKAEGIGKVQDGFLWKLRGVFSNIEVSGFYSTLGNWVRNKEEIKFSIRSWFWFLNKSLINICTLWRIQNVAFFFLKESLSNSLVYNDQGY